MKKSIYIVLAIILLFSTNFAQEQSEADLRKTVIDSVWVNNALIPETKYDDIVMAADDSITFRYHLEAGEKQRTRLLFRIILKTGNDSSNHVYRLRTFKFKKMPEDKYTLKIKAFDPRGIWKAEPAFLQFIVDNEKAEMQRRLDSLEREQAIKDSLLAESKKKENSGRIFDFSSTELIIFSVILFTLFILILFVIIFYKRRQKAAQNKTKKALQELDSLREDAQMNQEEKNISESEHQKLLKENNDLQAELKALRAQIDGMQTRGEELQNQNKELQEQVKRLTNMKEELEDLQNQKDELFAVIIHDIKNPAALIKSLVDLLRSYDLTANEQQDIMNDIFETTTRIVALSQEVSKILALEGGRLKMDFEQLQVNDICDHIYRTNKYAADEKDIQLSLDLDEELPEAEVDAQKVEEVLDNLVSNAVKFTQKGGDVQIRSHHKNGEIVIDVSDNGLGLAEEDIKEAFKRGAKLSAQPTGGESSTGLGLWIVKKLIEAHKGRVWVKSSVGKGSTFSFSLPIVREVEEEVIVEP